MSVTVAEALDYSPKEISAGSYVLRLVNPENGQPNPPLSSTVTTDFLLPNVVYNLSKSYLNFSYLINGEAAKFIAAHTGFLAPIDGIVLSTASGQRLVEMNNVDVFTKLVWRPMTNYEEYMTFPNHNTPSFTYAPQAMNAGVQCINQAALAGSAPVVATYVPPGAFSIAPSTLVAASPPVLAASCPEVGQLFNRAQCPVLGTAVAGQIAYDALCYTGDSIHQCGAQHVSQEDGQGYTMAADPYNTPANIIGNPVENDVNAGAIGMRVQLPLNMIYGSLLAVDKDLFFNEQLRLTIRWQQGAKWGLRSEVTLRAVGAATDDLHTAPTMTQNVSLRLAVEVNEAIVAGIKQRVLADAGIQIRTPFTHVFKGLGSAAANDTSTIIRKLNRGHGSKLLRVVSGLFSNNDEGARHCSLYNYSHAKPPVFPKWVSYRTFLDSKPLADDTLTMADFTAYEYHREKLKGSVIRGYKDWACVPAIIEDFSGVPYTKNYPETDHISSGLDLTNEREFSLQFTNGAAIAAGLQVYIFAICQKTLSITKSGTIIM